MKTKNAIETENAMSAEIAKGLVETRRLNSRQLLRIGYEADDKEVWSELLARKGINFRDFTPEELEDIGTKAGDPQVWGRIINDRKLTTPQLLKMGRLAKDTSIWEIIIPEIDLSQFDPEMLMVIGGIEVQNWRVWLEIVKVSNEVGLTINNLLDIGRIANSAIVWEAVIKATGELPK